MQPGLTMQELARTVDMRTRDKKDYLYPTADLTVSVAEAERPTLLLNVPDQGEFSIMPVAERQLTTLTGIPALYFDKMKAEEPALAAINANAWLKKHAGRRMIRTLGRRNRALLSPKYQRIDDIDVLKVALPILKELPGVQIPSSQITETKMYVHFVVPSIQGEVKVGDVVQAGGILSNSEVGHGRISVAGLIWRLSCLNGAKTADTFARSHVGREIEDNEALWSEETQKLDDRLILSRVRDMVKAVVDEARFRAQIDRLRDLAGAKISGDPVKAVGLMANKIGVSDAEGDALFKALLAGDGDGRVDMTAWGLVNATTALAHQAESYDRAVDFEAMGGKLIELPANDWREILQAA